MSHKFYLNSSFHLLLIQIDQELAKETQLKGCLKCQGVLDVANYSRSPFGLPIDLRQYYEERLSFCCRACRKRVTPPSVRFFGRIWYVFIVHLLFNMLSLGITEKRLEQIKRHLGIAVSESTWKRWRRWWRGHFVETAFWQQMKGRVKLSLESAKTIPRMLFKQFKPPLEKRFLGLLKFLSPLTGGNLRAI